MKLKQKPHSGSNSDKCLLDNLTNFLCIVLNYKNVKGFCLWLVIKNVTLKLCYANNEN